MLIYFGQASEKPACLSLNTFHQLETRCCVYNLIPPVLPEQINAEISIKISQCVYFISIFRRKASSFRYHLMSSHLIRGISEARLECGAFKGNSTPKNLQVQDGHTFPTRFLRNGSQLNSEILHFLPTRRTDSKNTVNLQQISCSFCLCLLSVFLSALVAVKNRPEAHEDEGKWYI